MDLDPSAPKSELLNTAWAVSTTQYSGVSCVPQKIYPRSTLGPVTVTASADVTEVRWGQAEAE
jgi:hypothetical protein